MPNRILKESVCTSDTLNQLENWFDEVVFYRLIVNCDDYGRFDGRPAILKGRLFPLKENITIKSLEESLQRLATVGLVTPYIIDGKPILQLPTWDKHQRIRAKKSKFPPPDGTCCQMTANAGNCVRNPIQSESNPNPESNPRTREVDVVIECYESNIAPISQVVVSDIEYYRSKEFPDDLLIECIETAVRANKRNWNYVKGILKRLEAEGVKSKAAFLSGGKKGQYVSASYDLEELDRYWDEVPKME